MDNPRYERSGYIEGNLAISYKLIAQAVDTSVTGVIITDNEQPDNPIIYCNKAFEELSGYNRSEIIGRNCRFLQRDDREQAARNVLRDAVKAGKSAKVEIRNYTKDGSLFWNELIISPVCGDDGEVTHFIGIQHDITDRKELYENLLTERRKLDERVAERTKTLQVEQDFANSILETIRQSLLVLDSNLNVLSANEHFLRTFKVTRSDTENEKLYDLGNGQWNIPGLKVLLEKVLPTSNPVLDFKVEHDFPHIGRKVMLLNAHRVELAGKYKDRVLLAIEDITERKLIQDRKDDFLTIASHELKTPLTTIKGYVHLLQQKVPADASEQFKLILNKTDRHLVRLNNLISDLLDMSRIQTGNIELHKDRFDFDRMVADAVSDARTPSSIHEINIHGKIGLPVYGDETNLSQVISNLLSNAIKYSPDGGEINVTIGLVSNMVKFSVHDNGIGISRDEQSRIFERFYRVGKTQKKFPGMGIGLYISDQIIRQHDGNLWVESEQPNGSTFSFTIPVEKQAD